MAAIGENQAILVIDLGNSTTLNRLLIEEYITLGQRVKKFSVAAWQNGTYQTITQEKISGNRRIFRFPTVTTSRIRVNTEDPKASPPIRLIELYNSSQLMVTPPISRSKAGLVTITCPHTTDPVITNTTDGMEPIASSQRFSKPFTLVQGGTVKAPYEKSE